MRVSRDRPGRLEDTHEQRRLDPVRTFLVMAAMLIGLQSVAQATIEGISAVHDGRKIFTLSVDPSAARHTADINGIAITTERHQSLVRYVAHADGKRVESDWFNVEKIVRWMAFDPVERKFHTLTNELQVKAKDYAELAALATELGAVRFHVLAQLDRASVWLPEETNPAVAAAKLLSSATVTGVEVQVLRPPEMPM